jgi:hypothetical protein
MPTNKEMQKFLEDALYDNRLTQMFLDNKPNALPFILKMNETRLRNGMTADEIDAVEKRAREAFESHDS